MYKTDLEALLRNDLPAWQQWRKENYLTTPVVEEKDLRNIDLQNADLRGVVFSGSFFNGSDLSGADLTGSVLNGCSIWDCDFRNTRFGLTSFCGAQFQRCMNLEYSIHHLRSYLDPSTLELSDYLPLSFLQGCGWPQGFIDYWQNNYKTSQQYYSCFISYSFNDQEFVNHLHNDLQKNGVRCWLATRDMKIGDPIRDTLFNEIRNQRKLLIVLSKNSISSTWVEEEVEEAFEIERESGIKLLIPLRLDDTVFKSNKGWVSSIRRRNIGDFTDWKEKKQYLNSFDYLLSGLYIK